EYAYWSITILLVLAFAMLPVLWIVSLSLKTPESVTDGSFIPHHWTLDNYNALFQGGFTNGPFLHPLVHSLAIALLSTASALTLASSNSSRTGPAALAFFTGPSQFTAPTGNIAAAAVIITVPIIVFVMIFQRRIVAGLTAGAVKG